MKTKQHVALKYQDSWKQQPLPSAGSNRDPRNFQTCKSALKLMQVLYMYSTLVNARCNRQTDFASNCKGTVGMSSNLYPTPIFADVSQILRQEIHF